MKLSSSALQILKSFSLINPSLYHPGGDILSTISPTKTIMVRAKIDQEIAEEFAVYDLSKFLAVLSLIPEADVLIDSRFITLKGPGGEKISYTRADPSNFLTPPKEGIKFPSIDLAFNLDADVLSKLLKALGVLSLPEIAITVEEGIVYLEAVDSKNPTGDTYRVRVGEAAGEDMKLLIKAENLKVIPGDYTVSISKKGLAMFESNFKEIARQFEVTYWIAVEAGSKV